MALTDETGSGVYRRLLLPAGILSGAIIGAGVFSLPYILRPFGAGFAGVLLAVFGIIFAFTHTLYADLVLRTPGNPNFVGVARYYLGAPGLWLTLLTGVLQMFFVLLIYLVLAQHFTVLALPASLSSAGAAVFWCLGSVAIFLNVRRFAAVEFFITAGIIAIFGFIVWLGFSSGAPMAAPAVAPFPYGFALLAIGPVLFSLSGRVAIPEVVAYFRRDAAEARNIRRAIMFGTMLPALCYFFFVLAVWALSPAVTADTVTGLSGALSPASLALLGVLGILSLWSSYIVVGLNVKNILRDDLRWPSRVAGALVVVLPPVLYAFGFTNFLALVEFIGGTFLAIEGALVVFLWQRANRVSAPVLLPRFPWYALLPLYAVFALALLSVL